MAAHDQSGGDGVALELSDGRGMPVATVRELVSRPVSAVQLAGEPTSHCSAWSEYRCRAAPPPPSVRPYGAPPTSASAFQPTPASVNSPPSRPFPT